jgi:two-component system, OmpR family, sensor histidine kinase ArlS
LGRVTLLLISRIENEHYLKTDSVFLADLIKEIVDEASERYLDKNMAVTISIDNSIMIRNCNKQLLHILFLNIIGNAFKYSNKSGELKIFTQQEASGLGILFQDFGKGIDPDDLKFIFDRFKRFDQEKKDGIGLGLAIVKAIADVHNFKMSCSSERGKQTTFLIKIPDFYLS